MSENRRLEDFAGISPFLKPCGLPFGPKLLPNKPNMWPSWAVLEPSWAEVEANLVQVEPKFGALLAEVGPKLKTVHLGDFGPISKM